MAGYGVWRLISTITCACQRHRLNAGKYWRKWVWPQRSLANANITRGQQSDSYCDKVSNRRFAQVNRPTGACLGVRVSPIL